MTHAKGLARNPLGIIALFISLIYGFACLVLGASSDNLSHDERCLLIWFLVLFPVLILCSFIFLVTKHHKKLYAPSDFRDDSGFLSTFGMQNERLEQKAKELTKEAQEHSATVVEQAQARDESDATVIRANTVETNNDDELNSRSTDLTEDHMKRYQLVETLIFTSIENEYHVPVSRSVASNKFYFDGLIELQNEFIAFEVKYTKTGNIKGDMVLSKALRHIESVKQAFSPKSIRLMLIVVHEGKNIESLIKSLNEIVSSTQNQVDYRLYNFADLLAEFGINKNGL